VAGPPASPLENPLRASQYHSVAVVHSSRADRTRGHEPRVRRWGRLSARPEAMRVGGAVDLDSRRGPICTFGAPGIYLVYRESW
jgi:hypothetical protein